MTSFSLGNSSARLKDSAMRQPDLPWMNCHLFGIHWLRNIGVRQQCVASGNLASDCAKERTELRPDKDGMNLGSTSLGAQFSPIDTGLAPSPFCEICAPKWTTSPRQISAGAESLDTKALRLIHIGHSQKTKGERSMRMLLRVSIPVETGNAARSEEHKSELQ